MKTGHVCISAMVAALAVFGFASTASASSHREAPVISADPAADNTDLWAWSSGDSKTGTLHVVAAYNPLEEPAGGPNFHKFSDDVRYEIHLARGSKSLDDLVWYSVSFKTTPGPKVNPGPVGSADTTPLPPDPVDASGAHLSGVEFFSQISGATQTYSVTRHNADGTSETIATGIPVVPPNIGPTTDSVVYGIASGGTYADFSVGATFIGALTGSAAGGKVWAGPRDDGFYVDLGGIFDLATLHSLTDKKPQDNVAGYNCHAISVDIPLASLPAVDTTDKYGTRLGVWAAASRRKMAIYRNDGSNQWIGPWVQVSRLGLPLINEAVIGLQDKDKYNRTVPKNDVANFGAYFLDPIVVRDARAVGIYKSLGIDPTAYSDPVNGTVDLTQNRFDVLSAINILATDFPLGATGDVLRVDPSDGAAPVPSGIFPNGRALGTAAIAPTGSPYAANQETDVTDVELTLLLLGAGTVEATYVAGNPIPVSDGVNSNDANYLATIPYLATPWEGWSQGHGKPAP